MATDEAQDASLAGPDEPHMMRVTCNNHIRNFVSFALKFLQENPTRPLVMHTLPVSPSAKATSSETGHGEQPDAAEGGDAVGVKRKRSVDDDGENPTTKKAKTLASCTANVPRLLSVVEIVSREYFAGVHVGETGLHQYNEIGTLEDLGMAPAQEPLDPLDAAIQGNNFVKIKVTPYMKITLCRQALPGLEAKGATYQPPPPPKKKSRSARARERSRQKKRELKQQAALEPEH